MTRTILYVTRKWPPAMGGMETYSLELTDALRAIVPLQIMALPGRLDGRPPTPKRLLSFGLRASTRLLMDFAPPSIVHLGDMALWPLGFVSRLRSRRTQVILSAHGTDVAYHRRGGLKGRAYGCYLKLGARLLGNAKVVANSEATRLVSMETGWQRVEVVPLATHLSGPSPSGCSEPFILFAGRLVERKGCAWFIRNVLPALPAHLRLKVAGTSWDDNEWRALDHPRVDFLGNLDSDALVEAYRRASCVVVPNIEPASGEYEGFGLVATEAAAAGGVVVASRTGGLTQALEEGVTGILVTAGDGLQWQAAIDQILSWTIEERQAFLVRSMEFCRTYYSWDRVARETLRAYDEKSS